MTVSPAKQCSGNFENPFVYHYSIPPIHKFKMFIFTLLLFPVKIISTSIMFLTSLAIAKLITMTYPYTKSPIPGMNFRRRFLLPILRLVARSTFFCGGFYWLEIKGHPATRQEAPIFVVGPHSSFLDSLVVVYLGMSAVVTTKNFKESWVGALIEVLQPILVDRRDPASRRKTMGQIYHRSRSSDDWPQLVVFPEGTCTNRSSLVTFKPGAFQPGVPVQPVVIRWPNSVDSGTWVWEGPGVMKLLWMTMTQLYVRMQVEFLPVYVPSAEEKSDPQLYANNVRQVMADALQLPVCDLNYDDVRRIRIARQCQLPMPEATALLHQLNYSLFVKPSSDRLCVEEELLRLLAVARSQPVLSHLDFVKTLFPRSPPSFRHSTILKQLAEHYSDEGSPGVRFRLLLVHLCMLAFASRPLVGLRYVFQAFPAHSQSVSGWFVGAHEVRWLFCGVLSPNALSSALFSAVSGVTCADRVYEHLRKRAPQLLTSYEQYARETRGLLHSAEDNVFAELEGDSRPLDSCNSARATPLPRLAAFNAQACSDAYYHSRKQRACAKPLVLGKLRSA